MLELSPSSISLALMRSERGGASVGLCGAEGLEAGDEVESGVCEFDGAELEGAEFCAHRATLLANNTTKSQLRIEIILPPCMFTEACSLKHAPQTWVARKDCRHLRAVSSSEYRLPSCSMR